jgi:hypothetical protein
VPFCTSSRCSVQREAPSACLGGCIGRELSVARRVSDPVGIGARGLLLLLPAVACLTFSGLCEYQVGLTDDAVKVAAAGQVCETACHHLPTAIYYWAVHSLVCKQSLQTG